MASNTPLKLLLILLFLVLCTPYSRAFVEKKMVFYMHDTSTGSKITAIRVAGVNGSSSDLVAFGTVLVTDDLLTEGVEPSSKVVGRAKGMYSYADLKGASLTLALSAVFENEKFNGSTLQFQGVDPFFQSPREVSVVGGTGQFRYARGYAALYDARITGFNTIVVFQYYA